MRTKTLLSITLLFVCLFTNVSAQLPLGLISHWTFNGNFLDASGNGHTGNPTNVANGTGRSGVPNTAMVFNGTSSKVTTAYNSDLNMNTNNEYTICAIVKPMGYNIDTCQRSHIFARGDLAATGSYSLYYFDSPYDNHNCNQYDTSKNVFAASRGNTSGGNFANAWQYTPRIVSNTWYTVCATYNSSRMKIYVNGVQKSTYNLGGGPGNIGASLDSAIIGANYDPATNTRPNWYNGLIDDIRIYDRVLADSEIVDYHTDVYVMQPFNPVLCLGGTTPVSYGTWGTFDAGNIFTAELSDISGSFASPTNIGTIAGTSPGSINCFIPGTVPAGSSYRLRLVATSPAKVSEPVDVAVTSSSTGAPGANVIVIPGTIVSSGIPVLFSATVSNAGPTPTYQWRKNGVDIPGATNSSYVGVSGTDFMNGDTITMSVGSSVPCASPNTGVSNMIIMTISTGINDLNNINNVSIYPNPNKGSFTMKGAINTDKEVNFEITNIMGQIVHSGTAPVKNNELNQQLSISEMPNGVYMLRVTAGNDTKMIRFSVEK